MSVIIVLALLLVGMLALLEALERIPVSESSPKWWRWMVALVAFGVAAVMLPGTVLADSGAGASPMGNDVRGGIVDLILAEILGGVTLGLRWLWGKVQSSGTARKVIDFASRHRLAQQIASDAVDFARELKHQAEQEGRKLAGRLLEGEAFDFASDLLRKAGLPKDVERAIKEEMRKIILARLGAKRFQGA